jgi:hypothetical protein
VTDRPILFSAPMVRALLDGRKTQTRRIFKGIEDFGEDYHVFDAHGGVLNVREGDVPSVALDFVPYAVSDRLWVRENIAIMPRTAYALPKTVSPDDPDMAAYYQADLDRSGKPRWRPSIHMPRWASRLTLIVTNVRVQRLQEISEADAVAEGLERVDYDGSDTRYAGAWGWRDYRKDHPHAVVPFHHGQAVRSFQTLWDSLNASRGFGWDANPWVVALTFTVIKQNIDQIAEAA